VGYGNKTLLKIVATKN